MYLIPYLSAVHYRNLALDVLPATERQVSALERSLVARDSLLETLEETVKVQDGMIESLHQEVAHHDKAADLYQRAMNKALDDTKREKRIKERWRVLAYIGGAVAALGWAL